MTARFDSIEPRAHNLQPAMPSQQGLFEVHTSKSIEEVDTAVREAAGRHRFGVLAVHDLKQLLEEKGQQLGTTCRVYEVCNPQQAKAVLERNPVLSSMLPCRVSVYETGGGLIVSTVLPSRLSQLVPGKHLDDIVGEVERCMRPWWREQLSRLLRDGGETCRMRRPSGLRRSDGHLKTALIWPNRPTKSGSAREGVPDTVDALKNSAMALRITHH
jgi:uncharacterized protein (DUF302 family)